MPEKIREYYIPIGLALIGVLVAVSAITNNVRNDRQDACFAKQFYELSKALNARSEIAAEQSDLAKNFNLDITDPKYINPSMMNDDQRRKYRERLQEIRIVYRLKQEQIEEDRKDHPYPAYPSGKCSD